MATR
ncbi:hypothetical protein ZEAMMB73_Zm00001d004603 [Zea mays]|jgi:hypothetical protein